MRGRHQESASCSASGQGTPSRKDRCTTPQRVTPAACLDEEVLQRPLDGLIVGPSPAHPLLQHRAPRAVVARGDARACGGGRGPGELSLADCAATRSALAAARGAQSRVLTASRCARVPLPPLLPAHIPPSPSRSLGVPGNEQLVRSYGLPTLQAALKVSCCCCCCCCWRWCSKAVWLCWVSPLLLLLHYLSGSVRCCLNPSSADPKSP